MFLKVKNKIKMCTDVTVAQQTCICSIKKSQKQGIKGIKILYTGSNFEQILRVLTISTCFCYKFTHSICLLQDDLYWRINCFGFSTSNPIAHVSFLNDNKLRRPQV